MATNEPGPSDFGGDKESFLWLGFRKGHRELQQWDWVDLGVWAETSSTKYSWRRTGLREGGENITVLALDGAAL